MSLSDQAYSEKRSFRRMKIDTIVNITTRDGITIKGLCKDLSGAGMLIELNRQFPIGTELNVTISPSKGITSLFSAAAEVARIKPSSHGMFTVGLMIREIHE